MTTSRPRVDLREVRAVNAELALMPHPDVLTPDGLAAMRAASFGPAPDLGLPLRTLDLPGPVGSLAARVFVPDRQPRAVLLNLHGGGFVLGRAAEADWHCDLVARTAGVAVVSVDYRLAPEDPYPAAVEDCCAAGAWLAEHALSEFGTDRLVVGGSSAGGYLAARTLLDLRDRGHGGALVAASLVFGSYDLSMTPSQRAANDRTLVLTGSWMRGFRALFVPGRSAEELRSPEVSPLYADLRGLPPALFTVGSLDPLLDDSLFMAARWEAAGGRAQVDVWDECVHGFMNMYPVTGRRAWERVATWIDRELTTAGL